MASVQILKDGSYPNAIRNTTMAVKKPYKLKPL